MVNDECKRQTSTQGRCILSSFHSASARYINLDHRARKLSRVLIVDFMAQERTVYQDWVMDLFRVSFIDSYQLPAIEGTRCEGLRLSNF